MATNTGGALSGAASGAEAGSVFGPWGTVIGGVVGGVAGLMSGQNAPKAVPYTNVNAQQEQTNALQGNLANLGSIQNLSSATNAFQQSQASKMMEQAVPGYAKFASSLMQSGQNSLTNQYKVPGEVEQNLSRIASERGISAGTRGQFNQFSLLRDMGVNELQYGQQQFQNALSALTTVTGTAPRVSPMSPLSFMLTPAEQIQNTTTNNMMQQAVGQGAQNASAAAANWNRQNNYNSFMNTDWTSIFGQMNDPNSRSWTGEINQG
jgi:hypothetical protein